jgi:UPF0755 protein
MKDNAEYWKELLGDGYDEEIMKILHAEDIEPTGGEPEPEKAPPAPPQPRRQDPGPARSARPSEPMLGAGKANGAPPPKANGAPPRKAGDAGNPNPPREKAAGRRTPAREEGRGAKPAQKPAPQAGEDDDVKIARRPEARGASKPARQAPPEREAKLPREPKPAQPSDPEDDFNVEFDFDEEYSDVPATKPIRPNREKRSGCLGGILYAAFIICVSLLIASLGWLAATDVLGFGNENEVVQVTIPKGFKMGDVTDILYETGLIKYKSLFNLYARFSKAEEKIVAGTYALNKNYDYRALVNGMTLRGGKKVEIEVTIPEGYTLKQIFQLLDANRVSTEAELWDAAANYDFNYDFLDESTIGDKYRLEGYIFPDTYRFYVGDTPSRAINKMLSNFKAKYSDDFAARAAELGLTQKEVLTIASLIEKEAGNDEERPLISSVIHNRLKSNNLQLLQIDASIYYAVSRTGESFSTTLDNPYNTYLYPGLPPGPIASPGLASIKAALYPESTNYYYYALNKKGTHNFFRDFASHSAFVQSDEYGG